MCEYCGCQSLDSIDALTREHDEILAFLPALRAAAGRHDLPAARCAVTAVLAVLELHTAVEEGGLFPPMSREFPDHVARLEDEHRRIESAFAGVLTSLPASTWAGEVETAVSLLVAHIYREQDGLFPATLSCLEPAEWDALDALRATHAAAAGQVDAPTNRQLM